jgi:hypothetical protein
MEKSDGRKERGYILVPVHGIVYIKKFKYEHSILIKGWR